MKLSTRTRYGTRALLELALHKGEGPVFLKDIARRQQISLSYLEHIVAPLIAGGVLRSVKGPRGGVSLARDPADIKLGDVVRMLEGSVAPVECIDDPAACRRSQVCAARDVWGRLKQAMDGVLESTSLRDLAEDQRKKGRADSDMYYI